MTAITLTTLWINDAADPSDYQTFPTMSALNSTPQQNVVISEFAAGNFRAAATKGKASQWTVTLTAVSAAQRQWLEDHAGRLACFRDDRGRRIFGIYVAPSADEHPYNTDADVALTVNEVTVDEAV